MITYDDLVALSATERFELSNSSKHVAVLTNGSAVEAVFTNRYAFHAEELAVSYYLSKQKMKRPRLYVARLSGYNRMSRPCKHCSLLLKRLPNIRVFFTDETGQWVEERDYSTDHVSLRRSMCGYWR